jgi:hypothetical protein
LNLPAFGPRISPDGKHLAYVRDASNREGSKKEVVADSKVVAVNYFFGAPIFSPDSKHLAYLSEGAGVTSVEVQIDGKAIEGRQYVLNGSLNFNRDGVLEFLSPRKETGLGFGLYRIRYVPTP